MFGELGKLLADAPEAPPPPAHWRQRIEADNCLNKRSAKSRAITYRHLADLYGLDPIQLVFRGLVYFWQRDAAGRPLIALCASLARDVLLAEIAPEIIKAPPGATVRRESVEAIIEVRHPGRFSPATRKSVAQNLNATLTQSGHLSGRGKKVRQPAQPTPGSVAYALLLGHATGIRGARLFQTLYMRVQDVPDEQAMALAEDAGRKGWITFKRIGEVMEASFPRLLDANDTRLIHEQS